MSTNTTTTILQKASEATNAGSVALHLTVAALLAFGIDPLCSSLVSSSSETSAKNGATKPKDTSTALFHQATHNLSIAARVYLLLVVLAELSTLTPSWVLDSSSSSSSSSWSLPSPAAAASIAVVLWMGLTACSVKHKLLLQSVAGHKLGRVALIDRFLDFGIAVVTMLNVMDLLDMDLSNIGMQSVLSAGGVGALVFSLATQDLAQGLVGGLSVQAWDAFAVGDKILLDDGTEGTVVEIGLVETHVQGYDAIITRIPNRQLTAARVSNLSRVKTSRLLQTLRFKYDDLDKLPAVLEEIKTEIQNSCPSTITDGSMGFFAVLEEYHADHIGGLVIANFNIPPRTLEFISNRQEFMLAIARAMKKHQVEFAIPSIEYRGSGGVKTKN